MTISTRQSAWLALILSLFAAVPATAQDTGFKDFLKHATAAVMGQPQNASTSKNMLPGNVDAVPGTIAVGQAVTDGAVYRPTGRSEFKGIFDGYSVAKNVPRGRFPRVALTFETYGGSVACWQVRATIWQSARNHRDERFELCDAPIVSHDDLGATTIMADPSLALRGVIQGKHILALPGLTVTDERTTGPNPARSPFAVSFGASTPNRSNLEAQYEAILSRAMVVSGYVSKSDAGGSDMRDASRAGSAEQLMWVAGFAPGGNQDH
jgi:hypothetical protein